MQPANRPTSNKTVRPNPVWALVGIVIAVLIVNASNADDRPTLAIADDPTSSELAEQDDSAGKSVADYSGPGVDAFSVDRHPELFCHPITGVDLPWPREVVDRPAREVLHSQTPDGMILSIVAAPNEVWVSGGYADSTGEIRHVVLLRQDPEGYAIVRSRGCPALAPLPSTTTTTTTTTTTSIPPGSFRLPETTGMEYNAALVELLDFNLRVERVERADDNVAKGVVIETQPAGGDVLTGGSLVAVIVSSGPETNTSSAS